MSLLDTASLVLTPNAYKEGKLYSVIPSDGSGDFTFTRATTATRVNSDGLVELVPYNLLTYSEQFDNASWSKTSVTVTANTTTSPSGVMDADTISAIASSVGHDVSQLVAVTNGVSYTISAYFKKGSTRYVYINSSTTGGVGLVVFDLDTATITQQSTYIGGFSSLGDGWYRVTATFTATATTSVRSRLGITSSSNSQNSTLTTSDNVFLWGAQFVEGTNALPYQKTETRLNIPRLDYSLGGCPNILLEPQRTNLLLQSEDISSASWTKGNSPTITTNIATAPDGTVSADGIQSVTGVLFRTIGQYSSVAANSTVTGSVFIKKETSETAFGGLGIVFQGGTTKTCYTIFNAVTGTGLISGSSLTGTIKVDDYGNYWRLQVTTTDNGSNTTLTFSYYGTLSEDGVSVNPGAGSVRTIWGAQLEAGSYATSYIPTTTASVTRNADVCSKTGISSLIGQTEGTIVLDFTYYADNRIIYYFDLTESAGFRVNNIQIFKGTSNSLIVRLYVNSAAIFTFTLGVLSDGSNNKIAIAYSSGDTSCYMNGVQVGTSSDTFTFTNQINDINITETNVFKYLMLFKTRLTNAELATLTTL